MKKIIIFLLVLISHTVHSQVTIINSSSYNTERVEAVVSLSAKLLNVDSVLIIVKDMPNIKIKSPAFSGFTEVASCVIPENGNYSIYLQPELVEYSLQKTLIHEMIHVYQYFNNDLIYISTGIVEFRGEVITLKKIAYKNRPFEIEAIKMEKGIQFFILNTLAKS